MTAAARHALGRLYLITDQRAAGDRDLDDVVEAALAAVPAGAMLIQLRARDLGAGDLLALARRLRAITARRGALLLVNDRLDVALAAGADGVHLPERGLDVAAVRAVAGPDFLVGVSRHSAGDAAAAARAGADLIVCGPVWPTPSKPGAVPLGVEALAEAAAGVAAGVAPGRSARLFALGGVDTPARARAARAAGAHGVASIRALCAAEDPGAAAASMFAAVADAS
ncbi:MAG TPA: thiamine phosphate synthase [Haliangium sp.]|nr:thiamine phosphate synthase [Haliangium sp.]